MAIKAGIGSFLDRALKAAAMQIPAIRRLVEQKHTALAALEEAKAAAARYEHLRGMPSARYALPLEYPPSRDLRPRWGYSRPLISQLDAWFLQHADSYRTFLSEMRRYGCELADVPLRLDPNHPRMPGWLDAPFNPIDALALYTFARSYRPTTYLEIGSGATTCFAHLARQRGNLNTRIVSIDPEPRNDIDMICDTVIRSGLETCDLSHFAALQPGDIVFLDGSHRCFMNSDVTVFFIDVLPMLASGVIIHIHDVCLPWDYPPSFAERYWSEQYLLAVYLMAARSRIIPLFPAHFVSYTPAFQADLAAPLIETPFELSWGGGGSMWFTHT